MQRLLLALSAAALLLGGCRAEPEAAPANAAQASAPPPPAAPAAGDLEFPALSGRVVDQAGLLTDAQEATLARDLGAIEQRTSDQFVIVTVPSLGGRTIEDYARALGNHWGIGRAEQDNGVLLVVAPAERRTRIAVGYGLEPILTNPRTQAIVDEQMVPRFRDQRWYEGIAAAMAAIAAILIEHEAELRQGRP